MRVRLAAWAAFLSLLGILYLMDTTIYSNLFYVLRSGQVEVIADYIRSFGIWAVFASIALSIIMTFGLIIPFIILSGANGVVFGVGWGTVISWAGEVIGAGVAFLVYRYYFRPAVVKRFRRSRHWEYVERFSGERGFETVFAARVLPVIPSGILTAIAAISNISAWDFWWATILGKIPSVFVKTMVGHDLLFFEANKTRFIIGLMLLLILYVAAWWWKRSKARGNY